MITFDPEKLEIPDSQAERFLYGQSTPWDALTHAYREGAAQGYAAGLKQARQQWPEPPNVEKLERLKAAVKELVDSINGRDCWLDGSSMGQDRACEAYDKVKSIIAASRSPPPGAT